jgi:outer membrane murein-binding lipoprotein Lpp
MKLGVTLAAVAVVGSALSGCTDLSPIQNDIKDLRSQINRLQTDVGSMKKTLDNAAQASREAQRAADRASSTANQALALGQSNQKSIEATNEKLDRMFRRHLSK